MSDEIRTPMTAILGFADLLAEDGDIARAPDARREYIDTIKRHGEHLLSIINDILDLSKIEADKLTVESVPVSPASLVEDVLSLMRVRTAGKGIGLRAEFSTPVPEAIRTDPLRPRQILINLVGNAIKFTESGEVVLAAALEAGDSVEHKLRISKRLSEMLGGELTAQSLPQGGSTFTLTLPTGPLEGVRMVVPAIAGAVVRSERPSERPVGPAGTPRPLDGKRVLLAEDSADNQRLISFHLRKAGADVGPAENGRVAVEKALLAGAPGGRRFDLTLMDMQMPEMDGYQATRLLRKRGYTGPIIALTAHSMEGDRAKCVEAGCDDYAAKPINKLQLLDACARWCSSAAASATPTESAADGPKDYLAALVPAPAIQTAP